MKYKLIGLSVVTLTLIAIILISFMMPEDNGKRYHQHIEAEEKAVCTHTGEVLCSHLPIIKIDTYGKEIPGDVILSGPGGHTIDYTLSETGEETILSKVAVFDNKEKNNHIEDTPQILSDIRIRIRGNSSRHFEKKGYIIKLITDDGLNNPQSMMGMDSHHEWALHGPYLDKTLIRNYISYNLAGEIMGYAPNVRFCELVLNGEYQGLYLMTETITAGKEGARLSLSVNKKDNSFSGYLLRLDRGSNTELKNINNFSKYTYKTENIVNIEYPGNANLTSELANGICDDFSEFEKALYSYDYDSSEHGYEKYIDVDSFVDYFLINEFTSNYDAGSKSTYIYKGVDGKLHMCVWDFNNAFDNYQENETSYRIFALQDGLWYDMLFKDERFVERVIERYYELEKTYLNAEYMNDYIDSVIEYLGPAIDRNFEKWGHTFNPEWDRLFDFHRNPHSYDEAVGQLKGYIKDRHEWMSENIETLRQYSAESKVKNYNY
ncbi:MAG: CotH kinase family protein [Acutalibacteraceae bacterium]|nr:CotH kinase family protein [Acutalibacteraceae bacterium]